jgi:putative endonuclease
MNDDPKRGLRTPGAAGAPRTRKARETPTRREPAKNAPDPRRQLGVEGERRAAAYLARRGYRIEERNVRCGGVEVDLIVRRGRLVVFVEVKTRRSTRFGSGAEAIDARKRARMRRAASAWLAEHRSRAARVRFDVVTCHVEGSHGSTRWRIEHWPAAFDASD